MADLWSFGKMLRLLSAFLMAAGVAFGGVWGMPRDYVIENFSPEDQRLVAEALDAVAREHGLSDRSFWADDLVTFAYYTSDAGTIRARLVEKRGVVFVVFLAKARKTAEAIDVRLCDAFAARFGERFTRVPALLKKPNQSPEPTPHESRQRASWLICDVRQSMRWPIKSRRVRWILTGVAFCFGLHAAITGKIIRHRWPGPDRVIEGPIAHTLGIVVVGISLHWARTLRGKSPRASTTDHEKPA